MTHYFHPLDLTVNSVAKIILKEKFEEGIEVYEINGPLKFSILKPIHGRWLVGLYDHLRYNKDIIIKGFESAGIIEALTQELPNEDPFTDLD